VNQASAATISHVPQSRPQGLTSDEAAERLREFGPNILPAKPPLPLWRHVLAQLFHFFAIMLWIAGALAIVAGMPQLGIAIFVVIVLNGAFAFAQEYRAERSAERLRELLPRRATVIRDGIPQTISADELVPGDFVLLHAGDRISADLELTEAYALAIDTSTLTGESEVVRPEPKQAALAGTLVREGEATGVVAATGKATRLASIAQMVQSTRRPRTPLAEELDRLVWVIAYVAVSVGIVFLLIAMLVGIRLTDGLLFAIGVFVALVPESLLPTVTLSLAMGAQRMAERHALVRRLESVETLGSTTFICTDKTGTLTRNEMAVVAAWTPSGFATIDGIGYGLEASVQVAPNARDSVRELALAAARCSNGRAVLQDAKWVAVGNPMEAALDVFARRLGIDSSADETDRPVTQRFPFDPRRKRMSVCIGSKLLTKGAPDHLLPLCAPAAGSMEALSQMAERGLRVLAVASGNSGADMRATQTAEDLEKNLTLMGLIGIEDPPRPGVVAAISACRKAGIRIAMVTGDHSSTARAIAREVGLHVPGALVLEGKDLPSDLELLGALMDHDGIVISRVTPEQKVAIARALRKRGHVVAMTGDGVNDGPALREANIGVAMGESGTDVAREAADLVLLDDNFATIVAAIEQGRTTFANARRFLTYHLTDNVAELTPFVVWALSGGRFPLALGVLQVLCLDIGTDILPAVALGAEPSSPRALAHRPEGRHLVDRFVLLRAFGLLGLTESVVEMIAFLTVFWSAGWRPGLPFPGGATLLVASGAAFAAVVAGQMANAFACRSATIWPGKLGWFTNRYLNIAILCELGMLVGFLYIAPLAGILRQAPPSKTGYIAAALAVPAVLSADAIQKRWSRRTVLATRSK
jgi:magnesium-transporting ATPase (P-type)